VRGSPHTALAVLVLVYVLNFVDRQILSILNEEIQRDLGLDDGEMGFLYGTAFAVFYAVFGIPLGRLADVWVRRTLIAASLAVWSAMTALSGLARNFLELAGARIGVGIGEAGASPAAFSMLADLYPPARRATVLALYSSGIYLGAGLSLMIGGQIVGRWDAAWDGAPPLGLRGWQVAFFAVGIPGILLSLVVRLLPEPLRGGREGRVAPAHPAPFRAFFEELRAVVPPLTLWHLLATGAGRRAWAGNLGAATALAAAAWTLVRATGDTLQWSALAVGLYAAFSWSQALARRDPPSARLILGTPALRWLALGFALLAFTGYGIGYWTPPFFLRVHDVPIGRVGLLVGATAAAAGWLGVALGGWLADAWRARTPRGRIWLALAASLAPLPLLPWMLLTEHTALALALNVPVSMAGSMWVGVGAATVTDLVLPRMRATASAAYLLVVTFIGLALGPYGIGQLSDALGDLRHAMLAALAANVAGAVLLLIGARGLPEAEASLTERARAAGESAA
jgi:MFS family permease